MDLKEAAKLLDGREYREEMTQEEAKLLKEAGIVAVYGASDDLVEFDGAIRDEVGAASIIALSRIGGILTEDDVTQYQRFEEDYAQIEVQWGKDPRGFCWSYKTDLEHEHFHIYEDGEPYCCGIVFYFDELPHGVR